MKSKENIKKVALEEQLYGGGSAFSRYRVKAVGELSWGGFVLYEAFALLLADLGGALGYVLRKMAAKHLLRSAGTGLILGRGLILRHPGKISIGHRVAIDDHCFIDGSGSGEIGVVLGDGVILSRNCIVLGKKGYVVLQDRVDVGCSCVFASASGIRVGAATIIAANCYIGGSRYFHEDLQAPIMDQGAYSRGEIAIGEGCWLGAGAIVLDGVRLGKGVIVGAGAVVTKDAPDYAVLVGSPARIMRMRGV
jgi:acetyltransferase-like isoleucine patch superfamily enzyme